MNYSSLFNLTTNDSVVVGNLIQSRFAFKQYSLGTPVSKILRDMEDKYKEEHELVGKWLVEKGML